MNNVLTESKKDKYILENPNLTNSQKQEIIDFFNKYSLSYTATGSSGWPPSNGFLDNTYFYTDASDPYWQVEFQLPVTIEKYFFTYTINSDIWPTSWKISYSLDCSTFTELQTDAKKIYMGGPNATNFNSK